MGSLWVSFTSQRTLNLCTKKSTGINRYVFHPIQKSNKWEDKLDQIAKWLTTLSNFFNQAWRKIKEPVIFKSGKGEIPGFSIKLSCEGQISRLFKAWNYDLWNSSIFQEFQAAYEFIFGCKFSTNSNKPVYSINKLNIKIKKLSMGGFIPLSLIHFSFSSLCLFDVPSSSL